MTWQHHSVLSVCLHFQFNTILLNNACLMQEWITPQPSRRPDPVPDFEKLDTPKIRPLPGDPEQPDEEEEEEEEKKKKEKEDPDEDKPDPSQDPPE